MTRTDTPRGMGSTFVWYQPKAKSRRRDSRNGTLWKIVRRRLVQPINHFPSWVGSPDLRRLFLKRRQFEGRLYWRLLAGDLSASPKSEHKPDK
jgi:hypothetical protein